MIKSLNNPLPGEVQVQPPPAELSERMRFLRPYVRQSNDEWRQNWVLGERRLFDYLLVYFPRGNGVVTLDGVSRAFGPGNLLWIPPDTLHAMRGTCHCQYFHFDLIYDPARSHWDAFLPGGFTDLSAWRERVHPPVTDPVISAWRGIIIEKTPLSAVNLINAICNRHRDHGGREMITLSALTVLLVQEIYLAIEGGPGGAHDAQLMREAAAGIRAHPELKLNLRRLAARARLSESHFRKRFKEYHGVSPHRMWSQARCELACERLMYSPDNISEIAAGLGFNSVHNFSRDFKKWMRLSPSEFRNKRT